MKPRVKDIRDFLVVATLTALFFAVAFSLNQPAQGAAVCRQRQSFAHSYVQPVVQQYAATYYAVGQQLRQQAADTYAFRQSAEYMDYLRLKGFEAGVAAMQSAAQQQTPQPPGQAAAAQDSEPSPAPASKPSEPTPASKYPVLAANCAKCHSGEHPKGDIWLDGTVSLDGDDAAAKRDKIVFQIWNGHMPPKQALDDPTVTSIIGELYVEK